MRTRALASLGLVAACGSSVIAPLRGDAALVREIALVPQPTIVMTIRAPANELGVSLGAAIGTVVASTQIYDVDAIGPPFARYLDRVTATRDVTVEVGLPIRRAPMPPPDGDIRIGELPGGTAARIVHLGSRGRLGDAHRELDRWIADHRRRELGPRWEVYLTDPTTEPDETAQRTVVFAPLASAAHEVTR